MNEPDKELPPTLQTPTGELASQAVGIPRIDVVKLMQGKTEALLLFNGNEYRLRITRQGKLLLTK